MTARERLDGYLASLRWRFRARIFANGAAAATAGLLLLICAAVWLLNREDYSSAVAIAARLALAMFLAGIAVAALWLPLRRLGRDDGAHIFEERLPDQQGRIDTYLDGKRRESQAAGSPLLELLAADAEQIAARTPADAVVPRWHIGTGAAVASAAIAALIFLLSAGPGHWGYGSRHLLFGAALPREAVPVRRIVVTPGDATVRRNSDLGIRASIEGFDSDEAAVFVRFADQEQWERAPMQAAAPGQFEFKLFALRGPLQYYVAAQGTRSGEHSVSVVDLPRIERVRLTYTYPKWTGLEPATEEESRDIRAVAGTDVKVEVFADAPLDAPTLIVDGVAQQLQAQNGAVAGHIAVRKPGQYQIGARVADEFVALSDEYPIEIVADEKPMVEIQRPGRDWRATSIEEVPVRIQAQDDFRLQDVELRYAVNGGEWQTVQLDGGVKQSNSESLLQLEEIGDAQRSGREAAHLEPGDLISYYAVAKDRKQTVATELFMVQVQPFERRFKEQQGGGGGAMGDEQGAISERQREILLATWNLQRSDERSARSREQLQDSAKMLGELQATLAQQARTLAERTRARASIDEDERVKIFVESLERAASVMQPAAKHLNDFELAQAVPVEQQALQQLLRAEAAFREVQISMQRGDSGANGSQNARNFTEMFELEMDLEKNQYESESQLSMENSQQELDEAIRKLKALAERQERLAEEANRKELQAQEQRWRQEQLRREAEDLRRRLAQLQQQQQQSSSSDDGQAGQSGSQVGAALSSLNRALEQMRAANVGSQRGGSQGADSQENPEEAQRSAREASRNLQQALRQMDQPKTSGLNRELEEFANRADALAGEQRRIESDLYEALSEARQSTQRMNARGGIEQRRAEALVESKQKMASELTALQRDMRNAVHEHRAQTPEASRRLSDIVNDVEGSDVMYRLNRSAAEIYYGRAREAAPREGLITDALTALEKDLREAAVHAAQESHAASDQIGPEDLLAEVADLRRALQEAQRRNLPTERGDGPSGAERSAAGSDSSEGGDAGRGLAAWNPSLRGGGANNFVDDDRHSSSRQTAAIGERLSALANRMSRGQLTAAELNALRRMAHDVRRLTGDPMAAQSEAMEKLVDQLELSALAAAAKSKDSDPAHAAVPSPDSPRYREAVAEYYRRLGGS